MKKMNLTKLMAVLVVLCLITSTFVGSTLAKYVTNGTGTDSARVAKFGVKIETDGTMFGKSYKDGIVAVEVGQADDAVTVVSDVNVVAPGTNGTLAAYSVTGTPEVDVKVDMVATLTLEHWEVAGDFYCPIVFTVNGTPISGLDYDDVDEFIGDVKEAIEATSTYYNAGTDLTTVNDDLNVTWAWAYEGDNVKDTKLGDQAAGIDSGVPATIQLATELTITQVD